jgi:hypothetical protein
VDNREEFTALHSGLNEEFFPRGPSEAECVLDLALLHWQKHTLWRLRTATVLRDPFTAEIVATERKSWTGIRRGLREKAREERSVVRTMEASAADVTAKLQRLGKKMAKGTSPQEIQKLTPLLSKGLGLVSKRLLPLIEQMRQLPDAEAAFDQNYLPEPLEKVVRLEALLDARISKVLGRLVALKEFKRTPAGNPLANSRRPDRLASRGKRGIRLKRIRPDDESGRRSSLQTRMVVRNAAEAPSTASAAPSGYDPPFGSSKGAAIAKVVLRSGAIRKREKYWSEVVYHATARMPAQLHR